MTNPPEQLDTVARLHAALRQDPRLRDALRAVAAAVVELVDAIAAHAPPQASATATAQEPAAPPPAPLTPPVEPEPLTKMVLSLGGSAVEVGARAADPQPSGPAPAATASAPASVLPTVIAPPPAPDLSIPVIARRCKLKAEACRWAIERRRFIHGGELAQRSREIFERAASMQPCYLWCLDPHGPTLPGDDALNDLAGSYDALAAAIELVVLIEGAEDIDPLQEAFDLLAEAQSAVRAGCAAVDRSLEDRDQREVHLWLKGQASMRQIYIPQYMRLTDAADPGQWLRLQERVAKLRDGVREKQSLIEHRHDLLSKARFHAKRASRDGAHDDWVKLAAAVDQLVGQGVPATDRELRDLLLPLADSLPELEMGAGMAAVVAAVDDYREQLDREPLEPSVREGSSTLRQARELLAGQVVVLVGGEPREAQRRRIEHALTLAELRWLSVKHHQSIEAELLPQFRRPETSLFMTMTRFRSHAIGPQMRQWCKEFRKAYVELPGGYGVEQIAHQVVAQASQGLHAGLR